MRALLVSACSFSFREEIPPQARVWFGELVARVKQLWETLLACLKSIFCCPLENPMPASVPVSSPAQPVSAQLVAKFTVGNNGCMESYPCQHDGCKIVLSDGREKTVCLAGDDISALIRAISKEKITNVWGPEHFKKYDTADINVNELLSKIF